MKKQISVLLSAVLACSVFLSGCGSNAAGETSQNESAQKESVQEEAVAVTGDSPYWKKYEPVIQMTQNFSEDSLQVEQIPDGMSFDENFWTDWCKETYGIEWKAEWISTTPADNEQKMNLAMVSGELPDVIVTKASQMKGLYEAGKLQPLDELLDTYGSPLVKYVIGQVEDSMNGDAWANFSENGVQYALPPLQDVWATVWNNNWIRQDLLDELGLDIPETVEDMEKVMEAFKKVDPEGIGLVLSAGNATSVSGMSPITDAYGAYPYHWLVGENDELVYGSVQPEMKEALRKLNEWYQKGWIDTEFVVKDLEKANEAVVQGHAINYYGPWSAVWMPFPDMLVNIPEAKMVAYRPLKGTNESGKVVVNGAFNTETKCYAINAECKYPEAVIYLFNVFMDNYYRNNDAMRKLMKEEYQYDMMFEPYEILQPNNLDTAFNTSQYTYDYPEDIGGGVLNGYGVSYGLKMNQGPTELLDQYYKMSEVEEGVRDASELTELDITEKDKYTYPVDRYDSLLSSVRLYKEMNADGCVTFDAYAGSLTKAMQEKKAYLDKLELETFTNIIMGQAPIDEFDVFVENWKKSGGDDISKEINEWYQSVK